MRRVMLFLVLGVLLIPFIATARQQAPAGLGSRLLVDNDRVRIQRLSVPAGFTDPVSVAPNDQIAVQATAGEMEVIINGQKTVGRVDPGAVFFVPRNTPHQFNNVGSAAYDTIVVLLK